ncbi:hypothetical protein A9Q83_02045 [Alphaproteobacteria bacterium 46_93_T64]|nr:hypothetical protein A9Q83_02045 [Alphaproteobacteria bacterium 46_93_T64]
MDIQFPIQSLEVAATYKAMPTSIRGKLLGIRQQIFEVAAASDQIGSIDECLKWGEASYLTKTPKSGTTVRLGYKSASNQYAIYVPCQTSLIQQARENYPNSLTFEKNRAILFEEGEDFPIDVVREFLKKALSYHLKTS